MCVYESLTDINVWKVDRVYQYHHHSLKDFAQIVSEKELVLFYLASNYITSIKTCQLKTKEYAINTILKVNNP